MAEPFDPDREAGPVPLPDSNGSDEDLSEDDLDIDALVLVWKDDLLLDAIGAAKESDRLDVPFDVSADRQLVEALRSWRRDVESDPLAPVVGPDRARDARAPRRPRFRVPLVSALAAAVVLAFTALAAYGAGPDEALWPVTEVLYSQHAASVRAADDAGAAQAQAEAAMAAGQTHEAEAALHAAASRLPQVRNEDGQTKLQNRQRDLESQLDAPAAPKKSISEPGAPTHSPKTSAAPKPTSRQATHSARPESPSARANEPHDSIAPTTTPRPHPTSQPASASSTPPPHHQQPDKSPPDKSPRPTRSATTTTPQPAPSAARTDSPRKVQPVKPSNGRSLPTTPQPEAQATAGQPAKPSSAARTPANRPSQAAAKPSNSPVPTPRPRATPSPDDAPS